MTTILPKLRILLILCTLFTLIASQNATYTYKTVDNLNLTLDVYIPSSCPYSKYPVLFTIHGGGYVESSKYDGISLYERAQVLSLGFVYVTIDYRLNPGVLLNDIVQDVQDAYDWVRTELVKDVTIDVDAMVVMGRSAGGGLSLISGYLLNPRPKAVISFYPYCANLTDYYAYNPNTPVTEVLTLAANLLRKPVLAEYIPSSAVDPYWALFLLAVKQGKGGWLLVSTDPQEPTDQVLASLKSYSAVDLVDQDYPPTYLVHGLNDTLVPCNQSIMMANALKNNNIHYILDLVPEVGHAFDEHVNDTDPLWGQHIVPVFAWAQEIIENGIFKREEEQISS